MQTSTDQKIWEEEQLIIAAEKQKTPELFVTSKKEPGQLFTRIGILDYPTSLPKGYIKYSPLDFIVEEILPDDTVVDVDSFKTDSKAIMSGQGTIYADIVKVGISTLDAVNRIAEALNLDPKQIGYAGIKDAVALTSQTVSFRGGVTVEEIKKLSVQGVIIKNVVEGKGAVQIGALKGNHFTLFVRTEKQIDEVAFQKNISLINEKGIPNYFGPQRFGSPRFLSHLFGMHLLRGEPKEVVKTYFFKTSEFEYPFVTNLRNEAAKHWGDWPAVEKIFSTLPYTFRHELKILETLKEPGKQDSFVEALSTIDRQVDLWARAYASFLNNLIFSEAETASLPLPETTIQLLTENPEAQNLYGKWLATHGTKKFVENLKQFRFTNFIHLGNAAIPSRVRPHVHNYKIVPEGVAICFDLPKGAYATTVLMFLFDTVTGQPFPEWMSRTDFDSKELLSLGSIAEIKKALGPSVEQLMSKKQEVEGD
ncbi:MAG: tRNA pseudouridine(13) synthase TruD [Patescibacteria group bacterium]|jgi:TruD family tRNA pseudouridine synthase